MGTRGALVVAAAIAVAASPGLARAQDAADAPPPEPPPAKHHYAVQVNPLDWFIGRFGADFEALVAPHHAMTATLHGDYVARGGDVFNWGGTTTTYSGFGGELGWHVYLAPDELRGFWFGPSFLFGVYELTTAGAGSTSFQQAGLALDTGARFGKGAFNFDLAGGIQVAHLSNPDQWGGQVQIIDAQVRPRIITALGWAF